MKRIKKLKNMIINYFWDTEPKRYKQLYQEIDRLKPKNILEIGTWKGERAVKMIETAQKHNPNNEITYFGFDLFEEMTDELYHYEIAKRPPAEDNVRRKIKKTGVRVELFKGNTQKTLKENISNLPNIDFIFIDGGHSLETVENDWNYAKTLMKQNTVVIFDDYWNRIDEGVKPLVDSIDQSEYTVKILDQKDKFKKDWGVLEINLVKVTKK